MDPSPPTATLRRLAALACGATLALVLARPGVRAGIPEWPELSSCPLAHGLDLPAAFEYEPRGRAREAVAIVVLPAEYEDIAALVEDVPGYPAWVLLDRDGNPLLRSMVFDPATGRGAIRIGDSDDRIEGVLTRTGEDRALGLELRMDAGRRIKEAVVEIGVEPAPARCPGASVVFLRARWKVGVLTWAMVDETALSIPAFLVLALRDDLAARVLAGRDEVRRRIGAALPEARPIAEAAGVDIPADAAVELLRFEPGAVRGDPARAAALFRTVAPARRGKRVKVSQLLPAFFEAMSGEHRIVGWATSFRVPGLERTARALVPRSPGMVAYFVELTGGQFSFGVDVLEGSP